MKRIWMFVFCIGTFAIADARKCSKLTPAGFKKTDGVFDYDHGGKVCENLNTRTTFGNDVRQHILDRHNMYRANLANGCAKLPNGTRAPSGRDIKKLVYNCTLEAIAQKFANQCAGHVHSKFETRPHIGENLYFGWDPSRKAKTDWFAKGADAWWAELQKYGLKYSADNSKIFYGKGAGHFGQMAWANTRSVGCGFNRCARTVYMVCNYYPAGNINKKTIYQKGKPCKNGKSCKSGKCDKATGLCFA
uniref:SCP domain-containing protein n=1 Tax=Panagrellus redivivus TaxID=6233 RepID=A0A7E4W590_PANRE